MSGGPYSDFSRRKGEETVGPVLEALSQGRKRYEQEEQEEAAWGEKAAGFTRF